MRRGIAYAALLALPVATLPSCGAGSDDSGVLVINNAADPQTLDPAIQKGVPEHYINLALFEGLTVYDPKDLTPRPGVAESWEVSDDALTYTFRLRESKWSNGDPVTAGDFEWAWRRVLDPAIASEYVYQIYTYVRNSRAYYEGATADLTLEGWAESSGEQKLKDADILEKNAQKRHAAPLRKLAEGESDATLAGRLRAAAGAAAKRADVGPGDVGIRTVDDRTLEVTLETPTPYFLDLTAFFTYYPVHRPTVEKYGKDWIKPEHMVGNGPYVLREWRVKQYVLLEKNPRYWDAANVPDQKVKFLPIENQTTAFNLYEQGDIDWLTDMPLEYIEELKVRPDFHSGPFLTTYFYGFNVTRKPLDDKRVRRALALAINKEQIVEHITRAGEAPARSLVPPGLPGYTPARMPPHDPEAARKLLAEAGYPGGKGFPKFEVVYNTLESHKNIASAIQEMWRKELGIEVDLRNVEWKIYLDFQTNLEFDILRRGWVGDYTDPNTFIDMFTSDGGNNNTGWKNAEYDRFVHAAVRETDPARRMKLLHDAEAILMDELPIIPIYFYVTKNMWKKEVLGLHDNVRDTHPLNRTRVSGHAP